MSYKTDLYSMKSNNSSSGGGMGILGVLQIVFIVLKCLNIIDWPWMKVFIPLWIYIVLLVLVIALLIGYNAYLNYKFNNTK